jgi:hypothetical protein
VLSGTKISLSESSGTKLNPYERKKEGDENLINMRMKPMEKGMTEARSSMA